MRGDLWGKMGHDSGLILGMKKNQKLMRGKNEVGKRTIVSN